MKLKKVEKMQTNTFLINEENSQQRIDVYPTEQFPDFSRARIQKLLDKGEVTVNEKVVKANHRLKVNDEIVINIPDAEPVDIKPENIPLDIYYEDDVLLIVNKPKEMVVHPALGHYSGTLVNALLYHCQGNLSGINGELRPGIVHRIDKNTTGLLVVCKTDSAHNYISSQLKSHNINRKYHAIVHNVLTEDEGTINMPIGRDVKDRKKMAVNFENGKDAITHYKVLKRFQNFTYIECRLETGRTHQIRVHMSQIGHPVLGDDVYGPKNCPYHLIGQTLHAKKLGFLHPSTKKYVEFDSNLPEYFEKLLNILP